MILHLYHIYIRPCLKTHHVTGHPFQTLQVTEVQQHRRGIVKSVLAPASRRRNERSPHSGDPNAGSSCMSRSKPSNDVGSRIKNDLGVGWYWIIDVRWDVVSRNAWIWQYWAIVQTIRNQLNIQGHQDRSQISAAE